MLYRDRLRAILLERDEAEAHRKAWDTRGRGPNDADEKAMARLSHTDKGFRKLRESDLTERDLVHTGVLKDGTSYRIYGRRGSYTIRHTPTLEEIGVAYVNDKRDATDADHYMSSVRLEPKFQKQGIANALYDAIERTSGKPLLPSPTYQSPQAKQFWEKRKARKINLSAFDLERDEAAIHKKAWDTRGRKDDAKSDKKKKPAGHNVTDISGDANDDLEGALLGRAGAAEDFGKAMLEDIDVEGLTFDVEVSSEGQYGRYVESDREFQDEYDSFVESERDRLNEAHFEAVAEEHSSAMSVAMDEVEDLWDSFQVVHEQVHPSQKEMLPVDPPFEREELATDALQQMFTDLRVDLDRPAQTARLLDNEKISAYIQARPEVFAGRVMPGFDEDTVRGWSEQEGGYWGEDSGFDNWRDAGEASEPDYDSIPSYEDWASDNGYDSSSSDGDEKIMWQIKGSDGTDITRSMYINGDGEKEVHHDYFRIGRPGRVPAAGEGFGKDALRGMMREYERVGVEKVTVQAALSQGGYAWARYGFLPDDPDGLAQTVEYRLGSVPDLSYETKNAVRDVINSTRREDGRHDPRLLWKIADMRSGDRKIGQEILAGASWYGHFDLTGRTDLSREQMARFNKYVEKKQTVEKKVEETPQPRDEAEAHKKAWDTRGRKP